MSESILSRIYHRVEAMRGQLLGGALRAKTMRGGAWMGLGSVAEQAVRFGRNMILARLLAPGAFGTMAIVLSSAALIDTLTDIGLRAAIIQSPHGDKKTYLNASWWIGVSRALLSYGVIFLAASWIAGFYGRSELTGLLRVTLLSVLCNGAMSPNSSLAQREMKLGRWAIIMNGGGICGVILTVVLSLVMRDVWALAIGYCGENAFRLVLSYVLCPGFPSLRFDWSAGKELLRYSKGVFGLAILNLIIARADVFVLGRLYPLAALGLYSMAVALVNTPSSFCTNMIGQALLPAMASVQEDADRLNRILLEVTAWLALLGMPACVFVSLASTSLLKIAYGARYVEAAGPLSVASAVVFFTVLNAIPTTLLFARGRPALHRDAVIATAVMMVIAIYPAARLWGPLGGQLAALLAAAIGYAVQLVQLRFVTKLSLVRYGAVFFPPALGSAAMLLLVLGGRSIGFTTRPGSNLTLCVGSCLPAYAICAAAHRYSQSRIKTLPASEAI